MVAIYARQSVDKKDSLSIEGQIELCQRQAGEEANVYMDKGYSGKNINRPGFEQLMTDVCAGSISKILVYRLDRFSRSIADFGRVWEQLEKHNVQFESVTERFDTSVPMGRAMLNIIMTFAQLERETIADRVRDNYYHRFSLGAWPGGPAPMGYEIRRLLSPDGKNTPTLVPTQQMDTVIYIFERYAGSDMSLGELARELNGMGVPGAKRAVWDNVRIARILRNPVYVMADADIYWLFKGRGVAVSQPLEDFSGVYACNLVGKRRASDREYNDVSEQKLSLANHVGCISSELYLKCQCKLERNKQLDRGMSGKYSWLTGLLKCKSCGYAVKVNRQGDKLFLVCSGRSNLKLCDESYQIELRELEEEIANFIETMQRRCSAEELCVGRSAEGCTAVLELETKIERLVNALASCSEVSAVYVSREIERLHAEREELLCSDKRKFGKAQLNEMTSLDFSKLSFEEKKTVARLFIEKIELSGDVAEITWRF